jgi:DNA-binding transcriptional LysR family regulator
MNMDLSQHRMRYFETVKEHKSIRRAAEQLNTTPSVITRQIQTLENELGTELFERTHNGMVPTDAADFLTEFWLGCLAHKENLEEQLQALRGAQFGPIQISLSEGLAESFLDEALSEFIQHYPKVQIVANVKATNEIVGDVLENIAHIGMAYNPPINQDINIHASALHRIVVAMRPDHPLAHQINSLSFHEAIAYPCGTMPVAYGIGQLIQNIAYAETLTFKPAFTSNTLLMLKQFAKVSSGISFLTDFSVKAEVAAGELVAIPIDHPLLNNQYARVLVKANRPLTRSSKELLSIIQKRMSVFNVASD